MEEALLLADRLYLLSPGPARVLEEVAGLRLRPRRFNQPEFLELKEYLMNRLLASNGCQEKPAPLNSIGTFS